MIITAWMQHGEAITNRLSVLFLEGNSCASIAATLSTEFDCNLSRNAIIGKANRLGLVSPNGPGLVGYNERAKIKAASAKKERSRKRRRAPVPTIEIKTRAADVVPFHLALEDLTVGSCRYPFGDLPPFTFCGCSAIPGRPYCEPHEALCVGRPRETSQQVVLRKRKFNEQLKLEVVAA